jgi:hypothetical protein
MARKGGGKINSGSPKHGPHKGASKHGAPEIKSQVGVVAKAGKRGKK